MFFFGKCDSIGYPINISSAIDLSSLFLGYINSVNVLFEHDCDMFAVDSMNRSIAHFITMSNLIDSWHEFEHFTS